MAEEKYTRCPGCRTVFRVLPEQLALRGGQVRCGHCRAVFDGVAQQISLSPLPHEDAAGEHDLQGRATVTLRNPRALQTEPRSGEAGDGETGRKTGSGHQAADAGVDYEDRFAWDRAKRPSRAAIAASIAGIVLLVVLFATQALHHFRDGIAARWPSFRPALTALCGALRCEIRPLSEIGALSIEASDLQADPAHRGLLILSATLRNRAGFSTAYPYLELTLTDAKDEVVVRRAISPPDYLKASTDSASGIPGNGEVGIKLFIDASMTSQAGYRLYLFYP